VFGIPEHADSLLHIQEASVIQLNMGLSISLKFDSKWRVANDSLESFYTDRTTNSRLSFATRHLESNFSEMDRPMFN
jgi:hypothetical protein